MRVKICGITSSYDAWAAADAGADALGLNFVGGPRRLQADQAEQILTNWPPMATPVALVEIQGDSMDPAVHGLLDRFRVALVQLYGDVRPETVARLRGDGFWPIWVLHVLPDGFPEQGRSFLADCGDTPPSLILLDAYTPDHRGGTGRVIDWSGIARARQAGHLDGWPPLLLAGGLNPDNVAEAIRTVHPWGVDVASGIEQPGGGKSVEKMRAFVRAARSAAPSRSP
jgi:phosphoribosylanthranilate isomerase